MYILLLSRQIQTFCNKYSSSLGRVCLKFYDGTGGYLDRVDHSDIWCLLSFSITVCPVAVATVLWMTVTIPGACPWWYHLYIFIILCLVEVSLYVRRNCRLIRDGSPGRLPQLSHSYWAPTLLEILYSSCTVCRHRSSLYTVSVCVTVCTTKHLWFLCTLY